MLTGSTETSPWWNTQVPPPLRSLSTPQSDGVWLGAGRFLPRHSGDLEVKPIPQCCHWANAISGEHKDMEDVTEDTQLPAPDVWVPSGVSYAPSWSLGAARRRS